MTRVAVGHPVHAVADIDNGLAVWRDLRVGRILDVEDALCGEALAVFSRFFLSNCRSDGQSRRQACSGANLVKFH